MAFREDMHVTKLRVGKGGQATTNLPHGANAPVLTSGVWGVNFTIGTEAANAITINVQLLDALGNDVVGAHAVYWYYSTDSAGLTPMTTAHDGGTAAGTDGALIENVANLSGIAVSEADGDIDFVATDAGAFTAYLCIIVPATGALAVSDVITHAA